MFGFPHSFSFAFYVFIHCLPIIFCCEVKNDTAHCGIDSEHIVFQNVSQLITSEGYPVEEYQIQTKDGYILGVQRIPHGMPNDIDVAGEARSGRPAVLLVHGLLASAADWVLNFRHNSLGFILADAGYDVWLGNVRGSTYSRNHIKYDPDEGEFWQFTWDEMASYDLPAMIDFILNQTGQSQLYYVGHSQGTAIIFALLSENQEYNKKIKAVIALGPVTTVGYIKSPIRYLAPFALDIKVILKLLGVHEFLPNSKLVKILSEVLCDTEVRFICENILFLMSGIDMDQLNVTRLPVYITHSPAGTSTINVVHFGQMVRSNKFQKYDFGKSGNIAKYGQPTPPEYFVENMTTPTALFWGMNDLLADPVDVLLLQPKIRNLITSYAVPYPTWAHLDFVWGLNASELVYTKVLKVLRDN